VLRAAVAELLAHPGTPARVVLDEAIEIARRYGSVESGRFVNGVLDRIARRLRPGEF
jgi:N utilization substance protein B